MRLEDDSTTQLLTRDDPAVDDAHEPKAPHFAGEEPVPIRDSAMAELERERSDRVRTVTGAGRLRGHRPGNGLPGIRSATLVLLLLLVAGVVLVLGMSSGGAGRGDPSAGTVPGAVRLPTASGRDPRAVATRPPTPSPRPHSRRHPAPTAAERGAGRRRRGTRRDRRRQLTVARDRHQASDHADEVVPPPVEPTAATQPDEVEAAPAEPAPEPEPVAAPPQEGASSGPPGRESEGDEDSEAEGEFGFER